VWAFGEGSNFQLVGLKIEFYVLRYFQAEGASLTQTFVESCVGFEIAHLSILMVRRLAYPEIPALIIAITIQTKLLPVCFLLAKLEKYSSTLLYLTIAAVHYSITPEVIYILQIIVFQSFTFLMFLKTRYFHVISYF